MKLVEGVYRCQVMHEGLIFFTFKTGCPVKINNLDMTNDSTKRITSSKEHTNINNMEFSSWHWEHMLYIVSGFIYMQSPTFQLYPTAFSSRWR